MFVSVYCLNKCTIKIKSQVVLLIISTENHNIIDNKEMTSITFTDVSKAFDRVWIRDLILSWKDMVERENYCVG
jgi:hypothetical protein